MRIEQLSFESVGWKNFILNDPKSNIFSSPEMNQVFSISNGAEVFPLFAIEKEEIVAAVFPVLVKIKTPFPNRFTNRMILYSSPVYLRNQAGFHGLQILMDEIKRIAKRKALFIEIRNSESFPVEGCYDLVKGFKYVPYQNYILDLKRGEDNIWKSFRSSTRHGLRQFENNELIIREIYDNELNSVVSLLEVLYLRKNIPFIDKSIFFNAYSILKPKNYIRVVVIELNSQIIAARIILNYNRTIFDWYAASDFRYNSYLPNDASEWNSIKWGCENNYEIYDFGGGAIKGQEYGPAKFKEKFRGELVEYGRYRYVINKPIFILGSKLYDLRVSSK